MEYSSCKSQAFWLNTFEAKVQNSAQYGTEFQNFSSEGVKKVVIVTFELIDRFTSNFFGLKA